MKYCVYLTVYKGNKLPMFYIGSSSVERVRNGYKGSVSSIKYKQLWKKEIKENSNLFKTIILCTFDNDKSARTKELYFQQKLNVVKSNMYINMSEAKINGFFGCITDAHNKNKKAWTNGTIIKYSYNQPGEDWYTGDSIVTKKNKSLAIRKHGELHHNYNRKRSKEANKKFIEGVSKEYIVVLPNGEEIIIKGINKFCTENGLNVSGAHRVLNGTQKSYKNYIFKRVNYEHN